MTKEHINIKQRLTQISRQHPLEWIAILRTLVSTVKYRYFFRCAERDTVIGFNTHIINPSKVKIGQGSFLQDNVYMRAGINGSISLGNNVAINSFAKLFGHGGITVGDNAQIGPGSLLTTTTHDTDNLMQASFHPIVIGDWAWIGANTTILSGVTIGKHAVVGAGSVVTRDIPDYSVAVGTPAKVIRKKSRN